MEPVRQIAPVIGFDSQRSPVISADGSKKVQCVDIPLLMGIDEAKNMYRTGNQDCNTTNGIFPAEIQGDPCDIVNCGQNTEPTNTEYQDPFIMIALDWTVHSYLPKP